MSEAAPEPQVTPEPEASPAVGPNGYPLNMKPADMPAEQQAAYYKHRSHQNETRAKENEARVRELQPLAEQIRALEEASQTEAEKAVKAAQSAGEKSGREAALAEARQVYGTQLVHLRLDSAAAGKGMTAEALRELAGTTDRFLGAEGVDDDALTRFLGALPDKAAGPAPLTPTALGGGRRDAAKSSGLAKGADLYSDRHPKKTTPA